MELNIRNLSNSRFIKSAIKDATFEQLNTIREKVNFVVECLIEDAKAQDGPKIRSQNKPSRSGL